MMIPNSCSSTMSSQDKKSSTFTNPNWWRYNKPEPPRLLPFYFSHRICFLIHVMVLAVKPSIFFLHNLGSFLLTVSLSYCLTTKNQYAQLHYDRQKLQIFVFLVEQYSDSVIGKFQLAKCHDSDNRAAKHSKWIVQSVYQYSLESMRHILPGGDFVGEVPVH